MARPCGRGKRATSSPATVGIQVEAVEQPHRFSFRWDHWAGAPARDGNSLLVELSLTAEGQSTRLQVVESGFTTLQRPEPEKAQYAQVHGQGWDIHLASLQSYASGPLP